jgi:hypothetical protein
VTTRESTTPSVIASASSDAAIAARRRPSPATPAVRAQLQPPALVPVVVAGLLARGSGALGALAATALAQGIGLFVALIRLAAGRNPLSEE